MVRSRTSRIWSATSPVHAMRLPRLALTLLVIASAIPGGAQAQLPATRLHACFPAGGQQGSQVELTVTSGVDLEGVNRLIFSHPGITAVQKTQMVEGQPDPQPVANQFVVSIAADVPVGLHDVRAVGTYGVSNPRAFAVGELAEVLEAEPNQSAAEATLVSGVSTINGRIADARDVDFYRFAAKQGEWILIDAWAERLDSRMDVTLELFDKTGRRLAVSRETSHHDAMIDFAVEADGEYTLKVYDFVFAGGQDYFYRINLGAIPYIDLAWPIAAHGDQASVTIFGRNLPAGSPVDGSQVDGHLLEQLLVDVPLPADAAQRTTLGWESPVRPAAAFLDGMAYRLSSGSHHSNAVPLYFAESPVVVEIEPNNEPNQPQVVSAPCEICGRFQERNDLDCYQFEAKKDQVLWLSVASSSLGLPTNPYLRLQSVTRDGGKVAAKDIKDLGLDITGSIGPLSFDNTTDDASFRFVVPADGTYRLLVSDLFGETKGDPRFVYRLALRDEKPDFRAVAFAEYPLDPANAPNPWTTFIRKGGTDKLSVLVSRSGNFTGEVRVTTEGLPPGVTCPPATVGPDQNTANLIFSTAEDAADWVGEIQLKAEATIGSEMLVRAIRPAAVVWPGAANVPAVSRLARGVFLSIGGLAPYRVDSKVDSAIVYQSQQFFIPLAATRRGDFQGPLALTAAALPAKVQNEAITLNPDQTEATLHLYIPADAPTGTYSFYVQSSTQVPFTKDPEGKDKKPVNVIDPSTPITVTIAAGPVVLAPKVPGDGVIKKGSQITIPVGVSRRNGFAGPVTLGIALPPNVAGVAAAEVVVPADKDQAELVITAAADATEGDHPYVAIRARVDLDGKPIDLHQPIPLKVQP